MTEKKGTLIWLTPKSIKGSRTPMLVWGDYMIQRGWELTSSPSGKVDLIFSGGDGQIEEALNYKSQLSKPVCCYFWGYPFFRLVNYKWRRFYLEKLKNVAKSDMVLTSSLITYYQLADFGIRSGLCPGGIDSRLIDSIPPQKKKFQVMYLGRFADYRGIDTLIRAMNLLRPQPHLLLSGWGDHSKYEKLAKRIHIDVEFRRQDDREKIVSLKESMVFVCPCVYTGWGMPPIEALYAGTPVVLNDIPIHREIFKEHALYFSTIEECADLIAYVINNKDVAKELVEKGRRYVAENLTFEKAAERLEVFLNDVINRDIKRRLGERVRANPTKQELVEIYNDEARRNWRFSAHRFSLEWLKHYRCQLVLKELVGKKVLDVGCGYGSYCILFAKAGYQVVGLDISPFYINLAKELTKKYGVEERVSLVQGFAEKMDFENEEFDCVWVGDLFEHVKDPEKVMEECLRVVKSKGKVIFSTPHLDSFHDSLHLYKWDVKQFEEKVIDRFKEQLRNIRLRVVGDPPIIFGVVEKL